MIAKKTGLTRDELVEQGQDADHHAGQRRLAYLRGGEHIVVPAFPVARVADPTGVGDAYRAGLLKGIACGFGWELCGSALLGRRCLRARAQRHAEPHLHAAGFCRAPSAPRSMIKGRSTRG
jgi:adenosine kinase